MTAVLITGGAGFIGSHTAQRLLGRGYEVRALDILRPPVHDGQTRPSWLPDDVELIIGDIRDKEALARALLGMDAVVHLAAYQDYLPDFSTFFGINTVGTALLYEVIVERRLPIRKVVIASSQAAYGEGRHLCAEHGVIFPESRSLQQLDAGVWEVKCQDCSRLAERLDSTEMRVNPQNPYGLSKHSQELVALSLGRRYDIATTCMRYSITQGRWQSPRNSYSGICRIFTQRAQVGKPAVVFEDGLQLRDYVYVGDVAEANVMALVDHRMDYEVYNVGGTEAVSAIGYAELVTRVVRPGLTPIVPGYYRYGDTRHIVSDSSKLRALGWRNTKNLVDVIGEYAGWLEESAFPEESTDASMQRMLQLGSVRRVGELGRSRSD